MSKVGKLTRGLKWSLHRDREGKLPKAISEDVEKMEDVNFYTDFCKTRDIKKVNKMLINIRHLGRSPMRGKAKHKAAIKLLNSKELLSKESVEKPVEKPTETTPKKEK